MWTENFQMGKLLLVRTNANDRSEKGDWTWVTTTCQSKNHFCHSRLENLHEVSWRNVRRTFGNKILKYYTHKLSRLKRMLVESNKIKQACHPHHPFIVFWICQVEKYLLGGTSPRRDAPAWSIKDKSEFRVLSGCRQKGYMIINKSSLKYLKLWYSDPIAEMHALMLFRWAK